MTARIRRRGLRNGLFGVVVVFVEIVVVVVLVLGTFLNSTKKV